MDAANDRILRDLREQLSWDSRVDASAVEASVEDGRVTLSGAVLTLSAKRAVEEDARIIDGVDDVVNALEVRPPAAGIEDREIAEEIARAVDRSSSLHADMLDIRVENGFVTLTGSVSGWHARHDAYRICLSTYGVVGVDEDLVVR